MEMDMCVTTEGLDPVYIPGVVCSPACGAGQLWRPVNKQPSLALSGSVSWVDIKAKPERPRVGRMSGVE